MGGCALGRAAAAPPRLLRGLRRAAVWRPPWRCCPCWPRERTDSLAFQPPPLAPTRCPLRASRRGEAPRQPRRWRAGSPRACRPGWSEPLQPPPSAPPRCRPRWPVGPRARAACQPAAGWRPHRPPRLAYRAASGSSSSARLPRTHGSGASSRSDREAAQPALAAPPP
eukprot:scaffold20962_cov112-Isochrysis_galbana.AAC.3